MSLRLLCYGSQRVSGTDGSGVQQTPILGERMGGSATMYCNHTKGDVYFQMCWYRQLPGQTLELIVFISIAKNGDDYDYGNLSTEKFSASKSVPGSGTLTVKNLEPKDRGLYFCVVSKHSDTDTAES
uniref:Ig-like domain-containing protein n=1 Tax=Haplochromis burtoni TaxID=8153 RepID=A0A3Q2WVX5_HAPBU